MAINAMQKIKQSDGIQCNLRGALERTVREGSFELNHECPQGLQWQDLGRTLSGGGEQHTANQEQT